MMLSLPFLRSLLLAIVLSFSVPVLLMESLLMVLSAIAHLPSLGIVGQVAAEAILRFLTIFGNGSAVEGVLVIGLACSVVGGLFDTYVFYLHHSFHD